MSTNNNSVPRTFAVLHLPSQVAALVAVVKALIAALTGNAWLPNPVPSIADLTAACTALEAAQAVLARTKGAAPPRNEKRTALVTMLHELKAFVQKAADANREEAATIIQSAGLAVRKVAPRAKRVFAAAQGKVSGTIHLVAPSAARRASYEWQSSLDGGHTWVTAPTTLQARTSVAQLVPGTAVAFRYRVVTKTGEGDWSSPVSIIVK